MNNYSYSEMQNMQKRAMERVRIMQRNSEEVVKSAKRDLSANENADVPAKTNTQQLTPKITNMPPNFPEAKVYPDFKEYFNAETNNQGKKTGTSGKLGFEKLLEEPDKAILLGLIMLLKSENADKWLIYALMYILS